MTKTIKAALAAAAFAAAVIVGVVDVYYDMGDPQPTAAAVTVHADTPNPDVYYDM